MFSESSYGDVALTVVASTPIHTGKKKLNITGLGF